MPWFIATDRLSQYAVISSDNACAGDLPLSNVQKPQPTDRCRFLDVTVDIVIDIDMSDPMSQTSTTNWRLLALLYNNSSKFGQWNVIGASDIFSLGTPSYDSGWINLWAGGAVEGYDKYLRTHAFIFEPNGRPETYLRVTIQDSTPRKVARNVLGYTDATYFEIGNVLVADPFYDVDGYSGVNRLVGTKHANAKYGSRVVGLEQDLRATTAEGGPTFIRDRPASSIKAITLQFSGADAQEYYYHNFEVLRQDRRLSRPVFYCEDASSEKSRMNKCVYGTIASLQDTSVAELNCFEAVLRVKQML